MPILSPEVLDFKKDVLPLTGPLSFPLTHNYMFVSSFQRNPFALKGFLAAMLNVPPDTITDIEILNPIILGSDIEDKDIILDVKVCLNRQTIVDIEMQVAYYDYLPERFLHQLCRIYANSLPKGCNYDLLPPVIHIAIMFQELFPGNDPRHTEDLVSKYYLMNTKNHKIYTGNFHMEVLSLKYIENAPDKEDPNGVYQWAKLFKATTWEEFNMIAENNAYMESIATSVCAFCHDPKFVAECERRYRNELEYNSMMSYAKRTGTKEGLEIGIQQGIQKGIQQGIQQGIQEGRQEGIDAIIRDNLSEGHDRETILNKLMQFFSLSREDAEKHYDQYVERE